MSLSAPQDFLSHTLYAVVMAEDDEKAAVPFVQLLLARGADPNIPHACGKICNMTPLGTYQEAERELSRFCWRPTQISSMSPSPRTASYLLL
jgi:hypothetical protein